MNYRNINERCEWCQIRALFGLGTFTIIGIPAFIIGCKFHHMPLFYTGIVLGFIAVVLLAVMFIKMGVELHREHKENMKELGPPPENKRALSTTTNRIMDFFSRNKI